MVFELITRDDDIGFVVKSVLGRAGSAEARIRQRQRLASAETLDSRLENVVCSKFQVLDTDIAHNIYSLCMAGSKRLSVAADNTYHLLLATA